MSDINIAGFQAVEDPKYRYKMPRIVTKIEGRGNGIKTLIVNVTDLASALARDPVEVTKFFGIEVGALTICTPEDDRYIVNGAHTAEDLQTHLKSYIEHFILCKVCRNPETSYRINKKKELIFQKCKACGEKRLITVENRVTTHIISTAKRSSSALKLAAAAVALPGAEVKSRDDENDDNKKNEINDDDDDKKSDHKHHHHHHHRHHHHRHSKPEEDKDDDDLIDVSSLSLTSNWSITPSLTVDEIISNIRSGAVSTMFSFSNTTTTAKSPESILSCCISLCYQNPAAVSDEDKERLARWFPAALRMLTDTDDDDEEEEEDESTRSRVKTFIKSRPREYKKTIKFVKKNARLFYNWVLEDGQEEEEEEEEA